MFLTASDGKKISYNYVESAGAKNYLVLVHMMPATKESWQEFAKAAQEKGHSSIAIDLRGHGKSDEGPDGFQSFSDQDHQRSIFDIGAAVDFLKEKGAAAENIYFVGASIGANLALQYIANHNEFKKAVLLSAGLNYYGIATEPLVIKLESDQKVMFVASKDDIRKSGANSAQMNERLYNATPKQVVKELIIYEEGGHGTDLFSAPKGPNLTTTILDFLQ